MKRVACNASPSPTSTRFAAPADANDEDVEMQDALLPAESDYADLLGESQTSAPILALAPIPLSLPGLAASQVAPGPPQC